MGIRDEKTIRDALDSLRKTRGFAYVEERDLAHQELDQIRKETIGGMHVFYESLEGDQNPVRVVERIQGKVNDLINYIIALEGFINQFYRGSASSLSSKECTS